MRGYAAPKTDFMQRFEERLNKLLGRNRADGYRQGFADASASAATKIITFTNDFQGLDRSIRDKYYGLAASIEEAGRLAGTRPKA